MKKSAKPPLVAICGRPNVGKSTLFNRIIGKQRAIIHGEEGITRDRFYGKAEWAGKMFRVVDTGGIVEAPEDIITREMQAQVRMALKEAAVLLFVVDAQHEITRTDYEVRDELLKYNKPIVLAANKLDNEKLEQNRFDFFELGVGEPFAVSSGHGLGMEDLLDAVVAHLPEPADMPVEEEEEDTTIKVAVIGKPNVGKSSFINALLNEERTIVTNVPGTTRDAIDIDFTWKDQKYLLIDTAGLRKKAGIREDVERFSVARTLRAVRRADVCLVMVDAVEGLAEQDKRIVNYVVENGTAMVLVWTKWDLIEDKEKKFKALAEDIDFKAPFLKYVPYMTVSNVTRKRIYTVFEYIDRVAAAAKLRIGTGELNAFFKELQTTQKPPSHKGKAAKIYYVTQASVQPTTFVLFVNQEELFHFSYLRNIENRLRERYGFEGVPIKVQLREGKPKE